MSKPRKRIPRFSPLIRNLGRGRKSRKLQCLQRQVIFLLFVPWQKIQHVEMPCTHASGHLGDLQPTQDPADAVSFVGTGNSEHSK